MGKFSWLSTLLLDVVLTPQYQRLQELYDRYQEQGFEILDFPCNQFMGQAPGSAEEINTFCSLHYQTSFPRFAKIKVNGREADPLYVWLKEQKSGPLGKQVEWNFARIGRFDLPISVANTGC